MAYLIVENDQKPITTVKWVAIGAEYLLEHHISTILRTFLSAMVRTHYGLTEGVANFSQNKDGRWHIDVDFAYVEFVPIDINNPSICKVVGTDFCNLAFPLVRYDTGDLVKNDWNGENPKIVEIYGRQEDYIELPNGVKLTRLEHIIKDMYYYQGCSDSTD